MNEMTDGQELHKDISALERHSVRQVASETSGDH